MPFPLLCLVILGPLLIIWALIKNPRSYRDGILAPIDSANTKQSALQRLVYWYGLGVLVYALFMGLFFYSWYTKEAQTGFHWFDDSAEWHGLDKLAHFYMCFHITRLVDVFFRARGFKDNYSLAAAASTGFTVIGSIELADGFALSYGASWYDLVANCLGLMWYCGQMLALKRVVMMPRISISFTQYAALRPNVLGADYLQRIIKDYNGQTYWLGINPSMFVPNMRFIDKVWPRFLQLSVGYRCTGMVHARDDANSQNGYNATPALCFGLFLTVDYWAPKHPVLAFIRQYLIAFQLPGIFWVADAEGNGTLHFGLR